MRIGNVQRWILGMATAGMLAWGGGAAFADELNVDNLPKDPAELRAAVEKIVAKADALVESKKSNPAATAAVLDVMMVRDNVMREIPKINKAPDGAKWAEAEGRNSIEKMLQYLKLRYDRLASL